MEHEASRLRVQVPVILGMLVLAGLLLRLPGHVTRPFHTDEANNAFLLQDLFAGSYQYRGNDHHGPVLFYVTALFAGPLGMKDVAHMEAWALRLTPLLSSLALAGGAAFLLKRENVKGAGLAAVLVLLAAPFSYYGVQFLHETLLLAWVIWFVVVAWRLREKPSVSLSVTAGILAALALGTKETAALLLGSFVVLALPGSRHALRSALVALPVCVAGTWLLFSHFGTQPDRGWDLFKAVGPQFSRGTGSEHVYPWYTYLEWHFLPSAAGIPWAAWTLALLGGSGWWLARKQPLARTLGLWSLTLLLGFSALPYKTPWLALAWMLPLVVLSGFSLEALLNLEDAIGSGRLATASSRLKQNRPSRWLAVLTITCLLGVETWQKGVVFQVDPRNPLAYSPSSNDLARLEADVERLAARLPEHRDTLVQVIASDYWPLPWTLRHFPQTGFWSNLTPTEPQAIVLAGPEFAEAMAARGYHPKPYTLRPGALIFLCEPKF